MENILEQLLVKHLIEIWNERDEVLRTKAIESVYAKDITLFEEDGKITGYDAINQKISGLLNGFPPIFTITQLKPISINNNLGKLVWGVGPEGAPPVATGTDIAIFKDGKIKSLYIFLDK
jgi:hypothetical protein